MGKKDRGATAVAAGLQAVEPRFREFDFAKMHVVMLDAACSQAGLKGFAQLMVPQKARLLEQHYCLSVPEDNLIWCETCGARSDRNLDACPYCGDDEQEEEEEAEEPAAKPTNGAMQVVAPALISRDIKGPSELENATARIRELLSGVAKNYWLIGMELRRVRDKELWKERKGEGAYKDFTDYARREFNFAKGYAVAVMSVAATYSEDLIARVGVAKLALVLQAPPDVRSELVEAVEKGLPKGMLGAVQRGAKAAAGYAGNVQEGKRGGARPGAGRPPKSTKLTVALFDKKFDVPAYARPKTRLDPGVMPTKRAKKLSDLPMGVFEAQPGTFVYVSLVNKPGGLAFRFETRKAGDE